MQSLRHLREGARTLTEHCVRGITANVDHLREVVEHSIGLVTALSPAIGYEQSSAIAAEALRTRRPIAELVLERGLLDRAELDRLLAPANLVGPLRAPFPSPNPDVLES
jgi:aspartate ammonia-lyase